jgi:hypothetical protein
LIPWRPVQRLHPSPVTAPFGPHEHHILLPSVTFSPDHHRDSSSPWDQPIAVYGVGDVRIHFIPLRCETSSFASAKIGHLAGRKCHHQPEVCYSFFSIEGRDVSPENQKETQSPGVTSAVPRASAMEVSLRSVFRFSGSMSPTCILPMDHAAQQQHTLRLACMVADRGTRFMTSIVGSPFN